MSSKANKTNATPATRTSARNKSSGLREGTARMTRAAMKTKDSSPMVDSVATPARKPLSSRGNAVTPIANTAKKQMAPKLLSTIKKIDKVTAEREPLKAFLRIRPQGSDEEPTTTPYLSALSETSVRMTDPSPTVRVRPVSTQSTYTFSRVFSPDTKQAEFFTYTALPLVRDLLDGQNGLLFAYGVTNSGKTYTIQGGSEKGEGGLLPRTLDVVFNSVDGLHSDAPLRPVRLAGVEYVDDYVANARASVTPFRGSQKPFDLSEDIDQSILASVIAEQIDNDDRDTTSLEVDRNYEYSVWVSYAEIYNEKVFDLLGTSSSESSSPHDTRLPHSISGLTATRSQSLLGGYISQANLATLASTPNTSEPSNSLLVKRKALALKNDPDGGKYIAGLREVRVRSAEEANMVVKMGQINRRVFGTLANSASSRSHGIFTLKILRVRKGCSNFSQDVQTARLSIIDLAGSERAHNTQSTGERLKEAGNINKSLMVLGQCMEALRANQKKLAAASPNNNTVKLGIVPFRHSKLTELFQDFFVGDGRAVMIVNVNPYDTGFDENSHVMRFSALARDVSTTTFKRIPPSSIPRLAPNTNYRKVTLSTGGKAGTRITETHLDILEEDEEFGEEESEPDDLLVNALFERIEELRVRLFETEMRCAIIESETRDEVIKEMEGRMLCMERMFTRRFMNEVEENQLKTDRKIDMLHQAGLIGTVHRQPEHNLEDLKDEHDVEESLVIGSDDELAGFSPIVSDVQDPGAASFSSSSSDLSNSPLAAKGQLFTHRSPVADKIPGPIGLFNLATEDEASSSSGDEIGETGQSEDETTEGEVTEDDDSDWVPERNEDTYLGSKGKVAKKPHMKTAPPTLKKAEFQREEYAGSPLTHKVNAQPVEEKQVDKVKGISADTCFDGDSTIIIPNRKGKKMGMAHAGANTEQTSGVIDELGEQPKKKKRTLGKTTVVTEDEIEAVTSKVAKMGVEGRKEGSVRRLRGSK